MSKKEKAKKVLAMLNASQLDALCRILDHVPEHRRGRFLERFLGEIYDFTWKYKHTITGGSIGGLIGFLLDSAIHIPFTEIHPTGWTLTLIGAAWGAWQGYQLDVQEQRIAQTVFQRLLVILCEELNWEDDGDDPGLSYAGA